MAGAHELHEFLMGSAPTREWAGLTNQDGRIVIAGGRVGSWRSPSRPIPEGVEVGLDAAEEFWLVCRPAAICHMSWPQVRAPSDASSHHDDHA